jgi:hypothetical protein
MAPHDNARELVLVYPSGVWRKMAGAAYEKLLLVAS